MKVILDTNFLLIPYQFKVDIFSEIDRIVLPKHKIYVLDKTLDELKKIMKEQKGKHKFAAKLGLLLASSKKVEIIKTEDDSVDNILVKKANKQTLIATQDMILKRRIKRKGAKIITLRAKKILTIV